MNNSKKLFTGNAIFFLASAALLGSTFAFLTDTHKPENTINTNIGAIELKKDDVEFYAVPTVDSDQTIDENNKLKGNLNPGDTIPIELNIKNSNDIAVDGKCYLYMIFNDDNVDNSNLKDSFKLKLGENVKNGIPGKYTIDNKKLNAIRYDLGNFTLSGNKESLKDVPKEISISNLNDSNDSNDLKIEFSENANSYTMNQELILKVHTGVIQHSNTSNEDLDASIDDSAFFTAGGGINGN